VSRSRTFTNQSGLQPERTVLAWQRTTLGLLANGGLFVLREADAPLARVPSLLLSAGLLALAVGMAFVGRRRERVLSRPAVPPGLAPAREVTLIGWLVVAVCAGAVVVLALPSGG
jgi:uncharacterized membrane protein YidH (DUF202 family)